MKKKKKCCKHVLVLAFMRKCAVVTSLKLIWPYKMNSYLIFNLTWKKKLSSKIFFYHVSTLCDHHMICSSEALILFASSVKINQQWLEFLWTLIMIQNSLTVRQMQLCIYNVCLQRLFLNVSKWHEVISSIYFSEKIFKRRWHIVTWLSSFR